MADELVDVINENNEVVSQAMKSEVHKKGLKHRLAAVLLQNEEGKYLVPTASSTKVEAGKLTFSAAGHVQAGDDYFISACRELWEETGIKAKIEQFELMGSFWLEKDYSTRSENERFEVFRIKYDSSMGKVELSEEQINEQWLGEAELKDIFVNQPEKLSNALYLTCKLLLQFNK